MTDRPLWEYFHVDRLELSPRGEFEETSAYIPHDTGAQSEMARMVESAASAGQNSTSTSQVSESHPASSTVNTGDDDATVQDPYQRVSPTGPIPDIVSQNLDLVLYDCIGPHTRRLRMFILEHGWDWMLKYNTVHVDTFGLENREDSFLDKNPSGTLPVLQTRGGFVTESLSICSYLEERFNVVNTERSLYGRNAEERAITASWVEKIEWYIAEPVHILLQSSPKLHSVFANRTFTYPNMVKELQQRVRWGIRWLEDALQRRFRLNGMDIDSDWYICDHNRFSVAEIVLLIQLEIDAAEPVFDILNQCPLISRLLRRISARQAAIRSCRVLYKDVKG